jgi:predicted ester cyclase
MAQGSIDTSRRFIDEAFNQGNLDVIDEICAEGFVDHDPLMGDQDTEGVKQSIAGYRAAFPDLTLTIEDIMVADDKVVMRWRGEGTFENEFMGQQPTGEKGDPVYGIGIDRYDDDGNIAEAWGAWDALTLMRNVGLIPDQAAASAS